MKKHELWSLWQTRPVQALVILWMLMDKCHAYISWCRILHHFIATNSPFSGRTESLAWHEITLYIVGEFWYRKCNDNFTISYYQQTEVRESIGCKSGNPGATLVSYTLTTKTETEFTTNFYFFTLYYSYSCNFIPLWFLFWPIKNILLKVLKLKRAHMCCHTRQSSMSHFILHFYWSRFSSCMLSTKIRYVRRHYVFVKTE